MRDEMTPERDSEPQKAECRALVALAQPHTAPAARPMAGFVTQLIACERRIGPYRVARRASSGEAMSFYAGAPEAPSSAFQVLV